MKVRTKCWLQGDVTGFIIEPGEIGLVLERQGYDLMIQFMGSRSVFRVRRNSPLVEVIDG